jgi:hypothetical protein
MSDKSLRAHVTQRRRDSVFALAFSSVLHHQGLAANRHILDIGCGGGCWSLLLAGPALHVTFVVSGAETRTLVLRMAYALNVQDHVTVMQSSDLDSAESFIFVLDGAAALKDADFMGFEMVVMLDLLSRLPPDLVKDLSAALRPYMHTRSKALVSVPGIETASGHSATEWCGGLDSPLCAVYLCDPLHFAGTSPTGWRSPWPPSARRCCGVASLGQCHAVAVRPILAMSFLLKRPGSSAAVAATSWS